MAFLCLHATWDMCVLSRFRSSETMPALSRPFHTSAQALKLKCHDSQLNSDPESGLGRLPFVSSALLRARQGRMVFRARGNKSHPDSLPNKTSTSASAVARETRSNQAGPQKHSARTCARAGKLRRRQEMRWQLPRASGHDGLRRSQLE